MYDCVVGPSRTWTHTTGTTFRCIINSLQRDWKQFLRHTFYVFYCHRVQSQFFVLFSEGKLCGTTPFWPCWSELVLILTNIHWNTSISYRFMLVLWQEKLVWLLRFPRVLQVIGICLWKLIRLDLFFHVRYFELVCIILNIQEYFL